MKQDYKDLFFKQGKSRHSFFKKMVFCLRFLANAKKLSKVQRRVIILRKVHNLSQEKIATLLGIPESEVVSTIANSISYLMKK